MQIAGVKSIFKYRVIMLAVSTTLNLTSEVRLSVVEALTVILLLT